MNAIQLEVILEGVHVNNTLQLTNVLHVGGLLLNIILAGGVFKAFGVIFTKVEAKYNSSAAIISWIPSVAIAISCILSKYYGVHVESTFGLNCTTLTTTLSTSTHGRTYILFMLVRALKN